jgi:hypothetical protein
VTVPDARAGASPRSSLLYYSPTLMLLLIVVADSAQFPDSDLWGHLRFRQAALTSGHIVAAIRILTARAAAFGAITNG